MIDFEKIIKTGDAELAEKIGVIIVDNMDIKKILEKSWITWCDLTYITEMPYYSCCDFYNEFPVTDWEGGKDYMDFNKREEDNCRKLYISGKRALEIIKER